MHRTQSTYSRFLKVLAISAIVALGASEAGCATTSRPKQETLDQQIADAKTRADHESLAAWYEQAAAQARQQAEVHQRAMERYQQSPYTGYTSAHHATTAAFAQRCKSAIRTSQQLAEDDSALAKLHRDLAAEIHE